MELWQSKVQCPDQAERWAHGPARQRGGHGHVVEATMERSDVLPTWPLNIPIPVNDPLLTGSRSA